jgi:hypothetical protein
MDLRSAVAVTAGLLLALIAGAARADTVRVEAGRPLARFDLLQPGPHRYLRYKIGPDGGRSAVDIWTRTISFEPREGRRQLHIVMRWDETADKAVYVQDSWFDPGTFRPITHRGSLTRDGKTRVSMYRFSDTAVESRKTFPDNSRQEASVTLPEPTLNFEYDMELLQVLPLKAGRTFDIPFYEPGGDPPARYRFAVEGSDIVAGPDGQPIDCWRLTADYNTGKVISRFWFAKHKQVLVREEQPQDDGSILVKTLLPPESGDAPAHFGARAAPTPARPDIQKN